MRLMQSFLLILFLLGSASSHAENPRILMKTNLGNITLELYPEKAPKTV